LDKLRHVLQPDGYLLLGAGESAAGLDDGLEAIDVDGVTFYRLKNCPRHTSAPVAICQPHQGGNPGIPIS
jgi:hypothetical protein